MRVLIVGGEKSISEFLSCSLEGEGYRVEYADTASAVLDRHSTPCVDILLSDASLPDMSALDFVKRLRQQRESPSIIVLGATATIEDRVRCLDAGADDYLQKPFALVELQARMRSVLRRSTPATFYLRVGDLLLDCKRRKANRAGKVIPLSPKEFMIIEHLMRNRGKTVSRAMIVERVWEKEPNKASGSVDVYIRALRVKVDNAHREKLIATVRGVGYAIRDIDHDEVQKAAAHAV